MCVLKPAVYDALPLALVLDRLTIFAPKNKYTEIILYNQYFGHIHWYFCSHCLRMSLRNTITPITNEACYIHLQMESSKLLHLRDWIRILVAKRVTKFVRKCPMNVLEILFLRKMG